MEVHSARAHRLRALVLLALILVGTGLLLTRCPANRDGMPGQLAQAMQETTSAARSGAAALDMWTQRRATTQLTSVALSDSRNEVVNAYKGIAELRAEDPVDIQRQQILTTSMTSIIGALNAASATVRGVESEPPAERIRSDLLNAAAALESGYR
ncbi:hypothetical protein ACIA48_18900 [Mycobacterium sp. NPDC051804]|uniref:hypothetical protein n=1 Tax=Mycobacterium sp. NPDC051804 TaxID=3364295 RepID=UPI0037AFD97A